jgi:hypothetical protein
VHDGEEVEAVFEANRGGRWPAGLVCTPTRVIFVTTFGDRRVAAFRYADLDAVFLTKRWHWMAGPSVVQVVGKGTHAVPGARTDRDRNAAVAAAPNVMEFLQKAGRRRAEEATVLLGRKIAAARS